MVRNIFFDFDSVIVDAVSVREEGFRRIFDEHPEEAIQELLRYHRMNGGLSRFVKIRYFFEVILEQKISEKEVQLFAEEFSGIMREILTDPRCLIEETVDFIRRHETRYRMHVISASEEEELQFLCDAHKLSSYFVSIHGSPTPKAEHIARIIKRFGYDPSQTLMIGYSHKDREAAMINGIAFAGYNNKELEESGGRYIKDFRTFKP